MEKVTSSDWTLSYEKHGNSEKAMLLFHGFGQSHAQMAPMVKAFENDYTCYNFDLFYHGESTAPFDKPISIDFFNDILHKFLEKEEIDRFSMSGFSLGGKYILASLMAFPDKVDHLYMVAPDGIKTSIWYKIATSSKYLRRYFRSMVRHPHRFFVIVRVLRKLGIIKRNLGRFVEKQMSSPDSRMLVYKSWSGIRHIKIKTSDVINALNEHDIKIVILLGENDEVIPVRHFMKFCKKVKNCEIKELEANHNNLIKKSASFISESLKQ